MRTVALFGGSFNPVCHHHVQVATQLLNYFDEVWLLPSFSTIGKQGLTSLDDRVSMCRLAVNDYERLKVVEIPPEYMDYSPNELLKALLVRYRQYACSFVLGADTCLAAPKWDNWIEACQLIHYVVVPRVGYPIPVDCWCRKDGHRYLNELSALPASASQFVKLYQQGDPSVCALIDPSVLDYIERRKLYR